VKPATAYTTQFLSGAGCEIRPTGATDGTLYAASKPGFMTFSVSPGELLVQVIQANGKVLFRHTLTR
jgi:tartrate-resistant acid phosphatase type 5